MWLIVVVGVKKEKKRKEKKRKEKKRKEKKRNRILNNSGISRGKLVPRYSLPALVAEYWY